MDHRWTAVCEPHDVQTAAAALMTSQVTRFPPVQAPRWVSPGRVWWVLGLLWECWWCVRLLDAEQHQTANSSLPIQIYSQQHTGIKTNQIKETFYSTSVNSTNLVRAKKRFFFWISPKHWTQRFLLSFCCLGYIQVFLKRQNFVGFDEPEVIRINTAR